MTNFEKITATPEALAGAICDISLKCKAGCARIGLEQCCACILDWLLSPAEGKKKDAESRCAHDCDPECVERCAYG